MTNTKFDYGEPLTIAGLTWNFNTVDLIQRRTLTGFYGSSTSQTR